MEQALPPPVEGTGSSSYGETPAALGNAPLAHEEGDSAAEHGGG